MLVEMFPNGSPTSLYGITFFFASLPCIVLLSKRYFNGPMCKSAATLTGKVAIVTGANTGIGKETAKNLATRGARVILACRNYEKCDLAVLDIQKTPGVEAKNVYGMPLDLASLKSVHRFVELFRQKENRLDLLVNNAGIASPASYAISEDGHELVWATNYLGPFLLKYLLLDVLKESQPSRIVNLSSFVHQWANIDLDDLNGKEGYKYRGAYSQSKLGNILFTRQLAKELEGTNVTTYAVHPGLINSDIWRNYFVNYPLIRICMDFITWPFVKDLEHGAQTTLYCAVEESLTSESGKYYSDCQQKLPSEMAQNYTLAKQLWDKTLVMLDIKK